MKVYVFDIGLNNFNVAIYDVDKTVKFVTHTHIKFGTVDLSSIVSTIPEIVDKVVDADSVVVVREPYDTVDYKAWALFSATVATAKNMGLQVYRIGVKNLEYDDSPSSAKKVAEAFFYSLKNEG